MVDSFPVELVIGELVFSTVREPEILGCDKVQDEAFHEAVGAIALDNAGEISIDLVTELPAVASAGIRLLFHRWLDSTTAGYLLDSVA